MAALSGLDMSDQWPEQKTDTPSHEDLEALLFEGHGVPATDACWVWYDEVCEHGHPAWTLRLGYNPNYYGITVSELND